jgi:hypothetical protein
VMEEHRAAHRIAGLALVQPGMAMLAQVGVSQPIGSPADLLRAGGEHRVRQGSGRHRPFTPPLQQECRGLKMPPQAAAVQVPIYVINRSD